MFFLTRKVINIINTIISTYTVLLRGMYLIFLLFYSCISPICPPVQITKNRYKQCAGAIYQQVTRQRNSHRLRLVAEGSRARDDDVMSVASTLDEILKSNLLLNKPKSITGGEEKLDDIVSTPRVPEVRGASFVFFCTIHVFYLKLGK